MESIYALVERGLLAAAPVLNKIGHERLEKPVSLVEKTIKSALFDCQMCGQCALSSTGMSCPMNCPKSIRNGPCGGVRADGVLPRLDRWDLPAILGHAGSFHPVLGADGPHAHAGAVRRLPQAD